MRKLMTAGGVVLALALLGCSIPPADQPPPAQWDAGTDNLCPSRDVPVVPPFTTVDKPRPPLLPIGWRYQTISFDARALPPVDTPTGREHCVPVALHVMVSGPVPDEGAGPILILPDGSPAHVPYDTTTVTPWVGAYLIVGYDPESDRWKLGPPQYTATFQVTYLEERNDPTNNPVGIRCAIHVADAEASQQMNLTEVSRFVSCSHSGSAYLS